MRVGFRSSTIICPKTTLGPPSVGYSRASNPFSARSRRTNAAVSGCAFLCAEIVGKRQKTEEHTSELQSHHDLVCRLLLEKKKKKNKKLNTQNTKNYKRVKITG